MYYFIHWLISLVAVGIFVNTSENVRPAHREGGPFCEALITAMEYPRGHMSYNLEVIWTCPFSLLCSLQLILNIYTTLKRKCSLSDYFLITHSTRSQNISLPPLFTIQNVCFIFLWLKGRVEQRVKLSQSLASLLKGKTNRACSIKTLISSSAKLIPYIWSSQTYITVWFLSYWSLYFLSSKIVNPIKYNSLYSSEA